MLKKVTAAVVASALMMSVVPAGAALNAYISIKGAKQGQIKGGVTQRGREDTIAVIAFEHAIISPRDPASGLPTGKRMHKPFVITKEVDKASPKLYSALATNEVLTEVAIREYAPNAAGVENNVFNVRMTNASIASISTQMANNKIATNAQIPNTEEVAFTYQKIEWTWVDGGITASDDWLSPGR